MYKQLKKQLSEKKILEEQVKGIEERIKFKIQTQLGLKATSYSELKIECPVVEDKFAKVFSQIEQLDKDLTDLKHELDIINKSLINIDDLMKKLSEREMNVFRCRYVYGLSARETALKLHYSIDRVKQITREILQR